MDRKAHHFPELVQDTVPGSKSPYIPDILRVVLNNADPVYILVDTQLKIQYFNDAAARQAELYFDFFLNEGASVLDSIPPEKVDATKILFEKVFKGEKITAERKAEHKHKTVYYVIKYVPANDAWGNIVGALITAENITETKLKEQALQLNEERWSFASEGSNQGMWDWNIITGNIYFSASWKKLFGFTGKDEIHHITEWRKRIHPQDASMVRENLERHFKSENPFFESVYRFKAMDDSYRWLLARGMVIESNSNGEPLRMLGTHTDITDLRMLEENYKTIFDANPLPSWTYCLSTGTFIDVNEAALKLYGFSRDEFLSMTVSHLIVQEHHQKQNEELHLQGQYYQHHRKKNGEIIIVNITGDIIQKDKAAVALAMVVDVTEKVAAEKKLQQSENQYRTLFHNNPLPTWIYEKATGNFIAVNEAAKAHYGYSKEEFMTLTVYDIHPAEFHHLLAKRLQKEKADESIFEKQWRHKKKNGELIYVDLNSIAIQYNGMDCRLVVVHDVTGMVMTKRQLQISNDRFMLATMAASEALWEWDIPSNKVYISPVYEQMFGFAIDISQNYSEWHDHIHPDDASRVINTFYEAIDNADQKLWEQEYRYLKSDGSYVYVIDHCLIIRDDKGNAIKAVGAMQDISKRKEAENAIKLSNERFYLASKATSDALYDWNLITGELTWGEGMQTLFNYQPGTVTIKNWESYIHPDEQDEVLVSLYSYINDPEKNTWKKEYRFQHANGAYKHVIEKGFIVRNEEGKSVRMIGALQDISDIKQKQLELAESNERFDAVQKATSDFIWDWNLEADTCYRDKEGLKSVLGVEKEKSINTFDKWLKRLHPVDAKAAQHIINTILRDQNRNNLELEYRFRKDDGTYAHIFDRAIVIRNKDLRPIRIIGAAQDITPRKKLEQKLLQKELEKQKIISKATIDTQEQERTEIGRELHDNVNQVLTTTKLYLELSQASPDIKEEMIQKASNNIVYVINEIRQLSRSLMNTSIDDLGLKEAIKDLVDSVNATKKLFVKLKIRHDLEKSLSTENKLMVYRILQEALNNIIKHAGAALVLIDIKKKGKNIEIIVQDNGIGFNIATVKKGMGLKNIQNRVYLVNGQLKIDSSNGNGCTLHIQIPY